MERLPELLVWYVVFLFSTTFHEFAHAAVAYWGGDSTAYEGGQVSLDPVPHIRRSPFGLVLIPLLSFFTMGWMIGWASAPFDPRWARRYPRKYALMSLAGPIANLTLALIAFIAIRVLVGTDVLELGSGSIESIVEAKGPEGFRSPLGALAMGLSVMLCLNVLLGVFNLLPAVPLDGASVLEGLFPRTMGTFYDKVRTTGIYYFLGIILAWKIFPYVGSPALFLTIQLLHI
jgi:Zn-dependent protease